MSGKISLQDFKNNLAYKYKFSINNLYLNFITRIRKLAGRQLTEFHPVDSHIRSEYNKHRIWGRQELLCYAPYKNLYFQPNGQVISCCFNRGYILGNHSDGIYALWEGEKLKKLRKYIAHDDLSLGCHLCYDQMRAGNFSGVNALFFDEYISCSDNPVKLEFELENTCNLECIMCDGKYSSSIRKNRENQPPLPRLYDEKFVDSLSKVIPRLKQAKFLGGEPFLINIYYSIWEKIINLNPGCLIDVQTNGTILTDRVKRLIEKGNFRIGVSIDSLNKETYENIRINARFETVLSNVKYFAGYAVRKGTNLSVSVCPMRMNWKEIPGIVSFCNQYQATVFFNTVYFPAECSLLNLTSSELQSIHSWLASSHISGTGIVAERNKACFDNLLDQINTWHSEASAREKRETECSMMSTTQLEKEILERLKMYILSDNNHLDNSTFNLLADKFKPISDKFKSDEIRSVILNFIDKMPVEMFFDILRNNSTEQLEAMVSDYLSTQKITK